MTRWLGVALGLGGALALPCPAPACSLCGGLNQLTLRQEMDRARMVLYGTLSNPRLGADGQAGTTDFRVLKVLKYDPVLGERKGIQLNRYLPVLDPRDPPRFVVFCDVVNGKIDPYRGRAVRGGAVLDYLEGAGAVRGKDRVQALLYYFPFLTTEDQVVADDAFLEFARSTDQEIGEVGRRLAPEQLRRLVQDPRTPTSRLGLFAFMLGACGDARDAALLRTMIERPTDRTAGALDGLLCGYISLRPADGWDLVARALADGRRPITERLAVSRTLRFFHSWKPAESRAHVLRGLGVMVADGDLADLAVEDLRRWKVWDLTDAVLAQYGKASHAAPIVKRTIGRYALCCPLPQARRFVQELRRQDPGMVRDLEEALSFEQQP
jgi:hypothetical protein